MSSPSPWARWSGAIRPREERGPSGQSVGSNPHRPPDALGRGPPAPVPLTWCSGRSQESDPAGRGPAGPEGACRPPFGVGLTRGGRQGSAGELCWSPRPFTLLCSAGPRGPPHVRGLWARSPEEGGGQRVPAPGSFPRSRGPPGRPGRLCQRASGSALGRPRFCSHAGLSPSLGVGVASWERFHRAQRAAPPAPAGTRRGGPARPAHWLSFLSHVHFGYP